MSSHSLIRLIHLLYVKKKRAKETQLKSDQYSYPILVDRIYKNTIYSPIINYRRAKFRMQDFFFLSRPIKGSMGLYC